VLGELPPTPPLATSAPPLPGAEVPPLPLPIDPSLAPTAPPVPANGLPAAPPPPDGSSLAASEQATANTSAGTNRNIAGILAEALVSLRYLPTRAPRNDSSYALTRRSMMSKGDQDTTTKPAVSHDELELDELANVSGGTAPPSPPAGPIPIPYPTISTGVDPKITPKRKIP
jgi:hypothetical protein